MRHDGPNGLSMGQRICRWLKVHSYAAPTIIMLIVVVSLIMLGLLCERFSLIAEIIAGAVAAVWVTVMLEIYSLPHLELMVASSKLEGDKSFVRVKVVNKDPADLVPWFPRKEAIRCVGGAEFFTADGKKRLFSGPPMELRWISTREPLREKKYFDTDLIVRAVDIYAGNRNARKLDIAFRTDGDSVGYPFNNENYEHWAQDGHYEIPHRCLQKGKYIVKVDVRAANAHCSGCFHLHNEKKFYLSRPKAS